MLMWFLLSPAGEDEKRRRFLQAFQALPYDKVDIPEGWYTLGQLEDNAQLGSPESDYSDTLFVAGSDDLREQHQESCIQDIFFSPDLLEEKLIFQKHFFDFRYRTKISGEGINLKYAYGGARDFIYFDWFFDYLFGPQARENSKNLRYHSALRLWQDFLMRGISQKMRMKNYWELLISLE